MRVSTTAAAVILGAILTGCGTVTTAPVIYTPSSTLTATGAVEVGNFKYLPAIDGKLKPNQLKNTAFEDIMLDQNVDKYFRDAVFTELRFVGVKVESNNHRLSGEINEFLVDDLGYSVDWTVDVRYVIINKATAKVVYDSDKITKNRTAKFLNPFVALNQQIKANIEALIQDPAFIEAINKYPPS
jgi:hypothetical protein